MATKRSSEASRASKSATHNECGTKVDGDLQHTINGMTSVYCPNCDGYFDLDQFSGVKTAPPDDDDA